MARAITTAAFNAICTWGARRFLKVETQDSDGTWRDTSALGTSILDMLEAAGWNEGVDQGVATGSVSLRRDVTADSLAPLIENSTINKSAAGTYVPYLDVARSIRVSTATLSAGTTGLPTSGDWVERFHGRINRPDWASTPITLDMADDGVRIVDSQIPVATQYASTPDTAPGAGLTLAQVITAILADMPSPPTLAEPAAIAWQPADGPTPKGSRMTAIRNYAAAIGAECRYRYADDGTAKLTLYIPARDNTTPDFVIPAGVYRNVQVASLDITDVRNKIRGYYTDASGAAQYVELQDDASIALYNEERFMSFTSSLIKTAADMTTLVTAMLSDLASPPFVFTCDVPDLWPVQMGDVLQFEAGVDHFDSDQTMAVGGIGVNYSNQSMDGVMTLTMRSKPAGAYKRWIQRATQPPPDTAPTDGLSGVGTADHLATRDINWVAGADVMAVLLYIVTLPASAGVDVFTAEYLATLTPIVLARDVTTYSVVKAPSGSEVCVRLEARSANGTLTDFRNLAIPAAPFDWAVSVTGQTSFQVVVVDPAGVVHKTLRVKAYVTVYGGVRTLTDPTTAPAAGVTGGTYGFTVPLSGEKHSTIVEPVIFPADGSDPLLTGALPFDPDNIANVKTATIVSIGSDAVLSAAFDTDAVVGAHGAEYSTDAGATWTNLAVDASYHASTTIARDPSVVTNVLLHGINSVGAAGPDVPLQVQPYLVDGPTIVATPTETATQVSITWDGVGIILLSIDGGAPSTPSASPIVVAKSSTPHSYVFTAAQAGQTVQATVDVPILDGTYGVTFRDLLGTADVGAGTLTVTWTATGFATGVTFDLVWSVDGGASGEVLSADPTGEVITTPLSGTPSGTLRVTAFDSDGLQLAIIRRTGVFAT